MKFANNQTRDNWNTISLTTCTSPNFPTPALSRGWWFDGWFPMFTSKSCILRTTCYRGQKLCDGVARGRRSKRQMGKSFNRHKSLGRAAVRSCTERPRHHRTAIPERSTRPKKFDGRSQHRGRAQLFAFFCFRFEQKCWAPATRTRASAPTATISSQRGRISRGAVPENPTSGNSSANTTRTDHVGKYGTAATIRNRTG